MTAHLMTSTSLSSRPPGHGAPGGSGRRRPLPPPALVVVAHGSRDPRALSTVRALLERVRALRPGLPVHLGHLELNEPLLTDTLTGLHARGTARAVLVPLLFGRGHHVKQDIPGTAAASPLPTRVAAPLGPHPLLVDALQARLTEAAGTPRPTGRPAARARSCWPPPGRATPSRGPPRPAPRSCSPSASASPSSPPTPPRPPPPSPRPCAPSPAGAATGWPSPPASPPPAASPRVRGSLPLDHRGPLGTHPALARLLLHRYHQARTAPAPAPTSPAPV